MGRPPCCDKSNVKKGLWTAEEDAKILHYVSTNGPGNWTSVPKKAGLKRCGKSCRLRWTNYLRPDLKHDNFTPEEEELIVKLHRAIGSSLYKGISMELHFRQNNFSKGTENKDIISVRWSLIAMQLPGRTDNDVKNHWNTKLRKKLFGVGIDPVTHKPFSQILSDYGNIGGLLKNTAGGARIGGSHSRDMKNAFMLKPDNQPSLMIPQLDGYPNIANQSIMTIGITPIQGYNPFINNNNNQSLELLAQLQAINITTHQASPIKQEINYCQPNFFYEGSSSSSSSSSSNLGQENNPTVPVIPVQTTTPGSSFSWREFLLEDAFLPSIQQDLQYGFSSTDSSSQIITPNELNSAGGDTNQQDRGVYPVKNSGESSGASSSNDISFIEALLDRDSQLRLECPNLLEEPFY